VAQLRDFAGYAHAAGADKANVAPPKTGYGSDDSAAPDLARADRGWSVPNAAENWREMIPVF